MDQSVSLVRRVSRRRFKADGEKRFISRSNQDEKDNLTYMVFLGVTQVDFVETTAVASIDAWGKMLSIAGEYNRRFRLIKKDATIHNGLENSVSCTTYKCKYL
jgi:hypothetical protein